MSLDASDLIDNLLDDQARVNNAVDDSDINNLVADAQQIVGEAVGLVETVTPTVAGHPNHLWDDGQTAWNFFTWA